jgi:hypothetical protein
VGVGGNVVGRQYALRNVVRRVPDSGQRHLCGMARDVLGWAGVVTHAHFASLGPGLRLDRPTRYGGPWLCDVHLIQCSGDRPGMSASASVEANS